MPSPTTTVPPTSGRSEAPGTPAFSSAVPHRRREGREVDDELAVLLLGQHRGVALQEADELGVRYSVGVGPDGGEGVARDDPVDDPTHEGLRAILQGRLQQAERPCQCRRDPLCHKRIGQRSDHVELGQLRHDPGRQLLLDGSLHHGVTREGADDGDIRVGAGDRVAHPEGRRGHRHEHAAEHDHDRREDREPSSMRREGLGRGRTRVRRGRGGRGARGGGDRDGVAVGAHATQRPRPRGRSASPVSCDSVSAGRAAPRRRRPTSQRHR